MTRLLMVSEPGIDGVFTIVESIVRQIHRDHPDISVDLAYSSRRAGPALGRLVSDIEARGDRTIDLRVGNAPGPSDIQALCRLVGFARSRKRQVVHAHSSKAGALARIARIAGLLPRVIYTPHAFYGMPQLGGAKEALFNTIESVLGRAGIVVCCSDDEGDFATGVLRIPARYVRVIHNGIDTARFSPADGGAKDSARQALGLPRDGKLLVNIGRDSAQKNYGPLYRMLDTKLPGSGWSFSHAGAGSTALRAGLGAAAAARCHNFEHLDDVVPLLHAADGFVMTSRYEGLSIAMLSALSCGLPTILTDAPGFHFLRRYGFDEISWLPNPAGGAPLQEALDAAVAAWAASPPELLMRQRELVCQLFSQPVQIGKLIALYNA